MHTYELRLIVYILYTLNFSVKKNTGILEYAEFFDTLWKKHDSSKTRLDDSSLTK